MREVKKVKENEMSIWDCLDVLSKKEIDKLYSNFEGSNFLDDDLEVKDFLCESILASFPVLAMTFNDDELKCLGDLIKGKKINNVSKKLLDNGFVFEINKQFVVPTEIKEHYNTLLKSDMMNSRVELLVSIYMQANGVLEVSKLIELLEASGVSVSKSQVLNIVKKQGYIVKKNRIYFNDIAEDATNNMEFLEFDDDIKDFVEYKNSLEYKNFSLLEAIQFSIRLEGLDYINRLRKILSNGIKNKNYLDYAVELIYIVICVGVDYKENIENLLTTNDVKLSKKEKKELDELIDIIYANTPSWNLNGYCPYEIYSEYEKEEINGEKMDNFMKSLEEEFGEIDDSFDDLDEDEQIEIYVNYYILVNGVIRVDKLLEILGEHGYKVDKKKLKKVVNDIGDMILKGEYLYLDAIENEIEDIISEKDKFGKYKVVSDIDMALDEYDESIDKVWDVCCDYKLDDDIIGAVQTIMSTGMFNEDILNLVLENYGVSMPLKKVRSLFKELKAVFMDFRVWGLNGYTLREVKDFSVEKEKIGRNQKCPCGSGKKYKQCCGK